MSVVVYPLRCSSTCPFRGWDSIRTNFATREALVAENEQLKRERLNAEFRLQRLAALETENARLRELLDSQARVGSRALIAEILAVDLDPYRQRFNLNRGLVDGVYVGQALIDAQGVVGQTVKVGPFTSEAVLITDADHGCRSASTATACARSRSAPATAACCDCRTSRTTRTSRRATCSCPRGSAACSRRATRLAASREIRRPDQSFAEIMAEPASALDRDREVLLVWNAADEAPHANEPPRGTEHARRGPRASRRRSSGTRRWRQRGPGWFLPALSLVLTLALSLVPLPHAISSFRPDWVAVVLLYWSLTAPRRFSLLTAFWMGIVLDTLSGSLLGQHALALLVIVYVAERLHLRIRVFPVSQLGLVVLALLGLYEFILFWIDGVAGRTVPLSERWGPPLAGTLVWLALLAVFDSGRREAHARL